MRYMGANNWIKYGWGQDYTDEWHLDDDLMLDFTNDGFLIANMLPLAAAHYTIEKITERCPPPYTLMCSGGIDSQAMIWAWHTSGVPFTVESVKYISDKVWYNEHDLCNLVEFSNRHSIQVNFKEFDIIPFLENDLRTVSLENDCASPQICTYISMMSDIVTGTIVFSGNHLVANPAILTNDILGMHRHSVLVDTESRKVIPFFFLHTPELSYSFMWNFNPDSGPKQKRFYQDKSVAYEYSCDRYRSMGFPVINQPEKLTGFEKLKKRYDQCSNRLSPITKLKYATCPSQRVFDLLFRYPLEKYPDVKTKGYSIIYKMNK